MHTKLLTVAAATFLIGAAPVAWAHNCGRHHTHHSRAGAQKTYGSSKTMRDEGSTTNKSDMSTKGTTGQGTSDQGSGTSRNRGM